jgi:chromosomal replication initiation ATPase DnaA
MVSNELDRPDPVRVECRLCGEAFAASFHWLLNRWLRPTVHDHCARAWEERQKIEYRKEGPERPIPERFTHFDPGRANPSAHDAVAGFSPSYPYHTLALLGPAASGKSRLMWATVTAFFDMLRNQTGAERWPDYFLFADLMSQPERSIWAQIKESKYVFIDDIGATESFGRDRALLQDVIRSRVQKGQWTFLTIDNPDFDKGFRDLFRERALEVYIK